MATSSQRRHWHHLGRPALFTETPVIEPGRLVFTLAPFDTATAQQLAAQCDGIAYTDGHFPVVRGGGRGREAVYLTSAGSWFGVDLAQQAGTDKLHAVWQWLQSAVRHIWRDNDLSLLATPGSTGRDLWLRTLSGEPLPTLPESVQDEIRSGAHQGRIEVLPDSGTELGALVEYDLRLAYLAVGRGLPMGDPVRVDRPRIDDKTLQLPGRWTVTFEPPAGWQLPGILPCIDGAGWSYPTTGEHAAVVDGCELQVAVAAGWSIEAQQALLWPRSGEPLRLLFSRLLRILDDAHDARVSELGYRLVRAAVRNIALHTIGAMHGAPHKVSRTGAADDVPADAQLVRIGADGAARWVEFQPSPWPETAHPEWTAHLWARNRRRLLRNVDGTGLLSLPAGSTVAVRTDAVFLTHDPGWSSSDDGRPGRWVHKRTYPAPAQWPASHSQLLQLRKGGR